jgi:head-tail adaptor
MPTKPGPFRETLIIQENVPDPIPVTSLTRTSTTATVQTATPHTYTTGDFVTIAGAVPAGYNGKWKVTVTGPSTFTYPGVNGALVTPATGAITSTYVSNAQGQVASGWNDFATIFAEQLAVRAYEKLQVQALQGQLDYRFRTHARGDLTTEMRARWTPTWPPGSGEHTLEIHGVVPDGDGRQYMFLEMGEVR